jgi:hypothetical protein
MCKMCATEPIADPETAKCEAWPGRLPRRNDGTREKVPGVGRDADTDENEREASAEVDFKPGHQLEALRAKVEKTLSRLLFDIEFILVDGTSSKGREICLIH